MRRTKIIHAYIYIYGIQIILYNFYWYEPKEINIHGPTSHLYILLKSIIHSGRNFKHYSDVVMGAMASQITSLMIVYSTVYTDQRKHQRSASLVFVRGIHRWPVNSPHKRPVTQKMFPFDDVIMANGMRQGCLSLAHITVWHHIEYVGFPHKGPVMWKAIPCYVIIMTSDQTSESWNDYRSKRYSLSLRLSASSSCLTFRSIDSLGSSRPLSKLTRWQRGSF